MSNLWGVLWRSRNKWEPRCDRHLMYENCVPVIFHRKRLARDYIKAHYGYIATRPDLRMEPHGWRMPIPVKVYVVTDTPPPQKRVKVVLDGTPG